MSATTKHRDGGPDHRPGFPGGRVWGTLSALALSVLLGAGCGDLTAGGLAETEVSVSGDAEDGGGGSASAPARDVAAASGGSVAREAARAPGQEPTQVPVGDVSLTVEVSMRSVDGAWIPLTGGLRQATVDISGASEAELGTTSVDPGLYTALRARFTSVQADVEAGLPILGTISVDLGDGTEGMTVEVPLDLELAEDASAEILLDLNSPRWLDDAVPLLDAGIVSAADFGSAVDLRLR